MTPPTHYTYISSSNKDDWTEEWMRTLGFVAYYFGQLEYPSVWLAEHLGVDVSTDSYADRCVDARKRLVPQLETPTLRADWRAFFRAAERCAEQRNKILHNPLEVNANQLTQSGISETQGIVLLRKPGRPVLLLGEVQTFVQELMTLHHTMLDLMKRTIDAP